METDLEIDEEAFPGMHDEMCLSDRERFDGELAELRKENVELLRRVDFRAYRIEIVLSSSTKFKSSRVLQSVRTYMLENIIALGDRPF